MEQEFNFIVGKDYEEILGRREVCRKTNEYFENKYNHAGIYCIKIEDKIVYVGKSIQMSARVAAHIYEIEHITEKSSHKYQILAEARNQGLPISFDVLYYAKRKMPDAIKREIGYKEGVLIRRYKPALNYQIPTVADWHKFTSNSSAKTITLDQLLNVK